MSMPRISIRSFAICLSSTGVANSRTGSVVARIDSHGVGPLTRERIAGERDPSQSRLDQTLNQDTHAAPLRQVAGLVRYAVRVGLVAVDA